MRAAVRKWLIRRLYPYGSERRVIRGPVKGLTFVVEQGIGLSYALGLEAVAPRIFERHIQAGMTVYDVGANKGQSAMHFARLVGERGTVVALEPAPIEFASLVRNIGLNSLNWVRPLRAAAADRNGQLTFMYNPDFPTQGKLRAVEPTYVVRGSAATNVRALTLDSLVAEHGKPDFIKIDVEGAAGSLLTGASRIIQDFHPTIYLELHGPEEQRAVRDLLFDAGYVAENMKGVRITDPVKVWQSPLLCRVLV